MRPLGFPLALYVHPNQFVWVLCCGGFFPPWFFLMSSWVFHVNWYSMVWLFSCSSHLFWFLIATWYQSGCDFGVILFFVSSMSVDLLLHDIYIACCSVCCCGASLVVTLPIWSKEPCCIVSWREVSALPHNPASCLLLLRSGFGVSTSHAAMHC